MISFIILVMWGFIWLLTWPTVTFYRWIAKKPHLDNCFTWAVKKWENNKDGYLVIRWCRSSHTGIKWPHFLFLEQKDHQQLMHFMPLTDEQHLKFIPEAFFEGKVQKGDPKETIEN